jgi:LAS superfamily LD-carboxypeptidase LdcB/LysM repeat protein
MERYASALDLLRETDDLVAARGIEAARENSGKFIAGGLLTAGALGSFIEPASAAEAAVQPDAAKTAIVVVSAGDTVSSLLEKYHSPQTPKGLAAANHTTPNLIRVGERLTIKTCEDDELPVRSGDNVTTLSKKQSVTAEEFRARYGITSDALKAESCLDPVATPIVLAAPALAPAPVAKVEVAPAPIVTAPESLTIPIAKGDTYYSDAKKLGVDVNALQAANPDKPATGLKIGDAIKVPLPAGREAEVRERAKQIAGSVYTAPVVAAPAPAPAPEVTPAAAPPPVIVAAPAAEVAKAPEVKAAPAPAATPIVKPDVAPMPPLPSTSLNLGNIQPLYGTEASRIQDTVRYLVDKHGFSPKGAAYMAASGLRESWLKTDVSGDKGTAHGLFQLVGERADGMPADFYGQIDHAVSNMNQDNISVKKLVLKTLRDPKASDKDVQDAIRWFERYDQKDVNKDGRPDGEGERFAWGNMIYQWISSPAVQPKPAEAPAPAPTTTQAPAPIAPPTTVAPPTTTTPPTTTAAPTTTTAPPTTTVAPAPQPAPAPEVQKAENKVTIQQMVTVEQQLEAIKNGFHGPYINKDSITREKSGVTTVEVKGEKINVDIAQQLSDLLEAAQKDGIDFVVNDGFRTKEDQAELRKINGCPDIWYAAAESCKVPTARPGESNHEDGHAIDFRYMVNGEEIKIENHNNPAFVWLQKNAVKFGFYNYPKEAWHWSRNGR